MSPQLLLLSRRQPSSSSRRSRSLLSSRLCSYQRTINSCRPLLPRQCSPPPHPSLNTRSVTRFPSSRSQRQRQLTLRTRFNLCNSSRPTSCPSSCKRCRQTLLHHSPCSCSTPPSSPSIYSEEQQYRDEAPQGDDDDDETVLVTRNVKLLGGLRLQGEHLTTSDACAHGTCYRDNTLADALFASQSLSHPVNNWKWQWAWLNTQAACSYAPSTTSEAKTFITRQTS